MDGGALYIGLFLMVVSMMVLIFIIRNAIDGSRTSKKLDILIDEIRMLRREIKENKHIIDKRA